MKIHPEGTDLFHANGWIDGWMDGWMDEWVDGHKAMNVAKKNFFTV
jgi:hypothetical protein